MRLTGADFFRRVLRGCWLCSRPGGSRTWTPPPFACGSSSRRSSRRPAERRSFGATPPKNGRGVPGCGPFKASPGKGCLKKRPAWMTTLLRKWMCLGNKVTQVGFALHVTWLGDVLTGDVSRLLIGVIHGYPPKPGPPNQGCGDKIERRLRLQVRGVNSSVVE